MVQTARTGHNRPQGRRRRKTGSAASHTPRACGTFILLLLVVAAGLLVASRQAQVAEISYQLSDLKGELARLEAESESARLEVARLRSVERVEHIATVRLGMTQPDAVRLVYVPAQQVTAAAVAMGRTPAGVAEAGGGATAQGSPGRWTGVLASIGRLLPGLGRAEASSSR